MKTKSLLTALVSILCIGFTHAATYTINQNQTISLTTGYVNNVNDVWNVISTVSNKPIFITYSIATEQFYDYLTINTVDNSGNVVSQLLKTSGTQSGTISTTTANGRVQIVFTSDASACYADDPQLLSGINISFSVDNSTIISENLYVNGNVGIGTYSPQEKLHINGSIRGNGPGNSLRVSTGFGNIDLGCQNTAYAHINTDRDQFAFNKRLNLITGQLTSYSGINLSLQTASGTNAITRLTILNNNGYVGIGTTSPDYLLTVKGTIHAREVLIDYNGPIADYVFSPDYLLMPLYEVEKFVKTNRHLPEIPSAANVKKDGLNMGEMQNKLLQKIEELTLYVIEQQKMIEQQNTKIDHLEKLVK
jgi:hypothetical protein